MMEAILWLILRPHFERRIITRKEDQRGRIGDEVEIYKYGSYLGVGRVYLCLSQSPKLSSSFLLPLSLSLFLFRSPAFPSMILSAASIGNPPVSYYSPVVRHCTHRTKHHGDSPAALSARDIWQYPNERSTGETTWEETRRRKGELKRNARERLYLRRNV